MPDAFEKQAGMTAYTRWWLTHPWHVTGTPESGKVPDDCDCNGCVEKRADGPTNLYPCANCGERVPYGAHYDNGQPRCTEQRERQE